MWGSRWPARGARRSPGRRRCRTRPGGSSGSGTGWGRGFAAMPWAAGLPDATGRRARLGAVLDPEFRANAIAVGAGRDGFSLEGFAGLPTYSKANALGLYLFVNCRAVRDKLMLGAVRAAYAAHLPRVRHPVVALFVTLDPREVDVNVHPAKIEVRFRDAGLIRALLVSAIKNGLAREGQRAATTGGDATIAAFRPAFAPSRRDWDW